MKKEFLKKEDAYNYLYKQILKRYKYVGLLVNVFTGLYEVMFSPPKEDSYVVVKIIGLI